MFGVQGVQGKGEGGGEGKAEGEGGRGGGKWRGKGGTYRSVIDSAGEPDEMISSSESSESGVYLSALHHSLFWYVCLPPPDEEGSRKRDMHTRVDKVVGIIVLADGARLRLVELGVLDFFELHHVGLLQGFCVGFGEVLWGRCGGR